jgi:hypothetical protein
MTTMSFKSTGFEADIPANHPGILEFGRKRTVTETPVLGQGVNIAVVQLSDWGNPTLKFTAWCDGVTRATLEGKADGTSGTLVIAALGGGTTSVTCYLVNVEPKDGDNDAGYVGTAAREFVLTFKRVG